ncbi:hypothetical protein PLICRDRAFT_98811 [Plicaturopsis crispa FD-325 SS-3]|nr:hypothetical protein PLICRDRAFT_98811 [Plicaturopsis crispa FD-325 SS-3]
MPQFIAPPPDERGPTPAQLGQIPQSSESILGQPSKPPARSNKQPPEGQPQHKRTLDMSLPGPEIYGNPEHAHILATKWMNASKLSELVRTEGLVYKKGKFSAIEEHQLRTAIEDYRFKNSLSPEQMHDLIFAKNEKGKENTFWSEITSAVPQRPIIAVYHHVRRSYHPMKQQGKWMKAEDDILKQAVMDLGQQWEKVSERVGRMSSDCRDRYRNHIANREVRVTGHWTKEEEDMLTQIVTEITVNQGRDVDNDVFWGVVSERMGNKRGRQQCRIKWTDSLSKTVKNEGQKPRWSQQDAFILVHKVNSLNVRDDTEIDWKILSDPHWNLWSAHSLQRRWLTMKRSIKGYEDMTHQEIMDILVVKKSHLPAEGNRGQKRKITSADTIEEDGGEAGSSTGPGTRAQGRSGSGNGTGTVNSLDAEGSTEEES